MLFREYSVLDYEQVKDLVLRSGYGYFPDQEELGGYGIVAIEDGIVKGYTWALIEKDSEIAFIQYFAIDKNNRHGGSAAPLLMGKMMADLRVKNKTKIIGIVGSDDEMMKPLVRMYKSMGLSIREGYVISGDIEVVYKSMGKFA